MYLSRLWPCSYNDDASTGVKYSYYTQLTYRPTV